MQKNSLMKRDDSILRVLECHDDEVLVIDCRRLTMPTWKSIETLEGYTRCEDALDPRQHGFRDMDSLSSEAISTMHKRFTAVAGILPFLSDEWERSRMIAAAAKQLNVSKHTVRNYLCLYLAYQDKVVLAPRGRGDGVALSITSKNIRWALNKFYYTKNRTLANIYMHNVLTLWFKLVIQKEARGECFLVNYADDFVAGFQYKSDAEHYYAALKERMAKFNLELEDSKSRLIEFGRYAEQNRKARGLGKPETFDFLGFTFYYGKSRKGYPWPKVKTSRKKFEKKLKEFKEWLYDNKNQRGTGSGLSNMKSTP